MCAIFVSFPVPLTLFLLPSLVRARVPSAAQAPGEGIAPNAVSGVTALSHSHAQNPPQAAAVFPSGEPFICLCHAMHLNCCTSPSVGTLPPILPEDRIVGVVPALSEDPCSVPHYNRAFKVVNELK